MRSAADFGWSAVYRLAEWSAEGMLAQLQGVDARYDSTAGIGSSGLPAGQDAAGRAGRAFPERDLEQADGRTV